MPQRNIDSEARWHGVILDRLKEMGWNTKSCSNGGQVYTQTELRRNDRLKEYCLVHVATKLLSY